MLVLCTVVFVGLVIIMFVSTEAAGRDNILAFMKQLLYIRFTFFNKSSVDKTTAAASTAAAEAAAAAAAAEAAAAAAAAATTTTTTN